MSIHVTCPKCGYLEAIVQYGGEAGPFLYCPSCEFDQEDEVKKKAAPPASSTAPRLFVRVEQVVQGRAFGVTYEVPLPMLEASRTPESFILHTINTALAEVKQEVRRWGDVKQ